MSRVSDSKLPDPRPKPGAALPLFVLSVVIGGVGAALDLSRHATPVFWIGALPLASAVVGAAAALLVALAGRLARLLLGRRLSEEGRDVRDHL